MNNEIYEKVKDGNDNFDKNIENREISESPISMKLDDIKNLSPEQLQNRMDENLKSSEPLSVEKTPMNDDDKSKLKDDKGWSDKIVDAIGSKEESDIYKDANLSENEVNGENCLTKDNIDWGSKDALGRTNKERAEQGLAPLDEKGKPIELHHIGQKNDGPLAELKVDEHRGKGNDGILHDKTKESEIDRKAFDEKREDHWKARANEIGGN